MDHSGRWCYRVSSIPNGYENMRLLCSWRRMAFWRSQWHFTTFIEMWTSENHDRNTVSNFRINKTEKKTAVLFNKMRHNYLSQWSREPDWRDEWFNCCFNFSSFLFRKWSSVHTPTINQIPFIIRIMKNQLKQQYRTATTKWNINNKSDNINRDNVVECKHIRSWTMPIFF